MGLFSKNKKEVKPARPSLPSLPKLPDFPRLEDSDSSGYERPSQLPSFPSSELGSKFSQNSIKEAVKGEEEDYEGDADDFDLDEDEERQMMQEPLTKPRTKELGERLSYDDHSMEPVFIRLDKFEDALKIFHETKRKVTDIEKTLQDIKRIREKEEKEFLIWENEVKAMKQQIEKINHDIFEKI